MAAVFGVDLQQMVRHMVAQHPGLSGAVGAVGDLMLVSRKSLYSSNVPEESKTLILAAVRAAEFLR